MPCGFQAWCESWATEAMHALKPGGYMLAFGAPRAYHRLAAGIEDAGFEMRDAMAWIRAAAKPAGVDLSAAFDRAAGVLDQRDGRRVRVRPEDAHSATHMSSHLLASAGEPITDEARAWAGWGTGARAPHRGGGAACDRKAARAHAIPGTSVVRPGSLILEPFAGSGRRYRPPPWRA